MYSFLSTPKYDPSDTDFVGGTEVDLSFLKTLQEVQPQFLLIAQLFLLYHLHVMMLFLSIGSTGDHPLVFLLAHLDPIVEVSQENDLGVQILAEECVEDARDGGVALLGLFLLCGQVAVDELEGLAHDGYFYADCALVPY